MIAMEIDRFRSRPEYKWLEETLIEAKLYFQTYQSRVPFLEIEVPRLVREAIEELRRVHETESWEWVVHMGIYEAALKYLNKKTIEYPFAAPPQYGKPEMYQGFTNIAPAPASPDSLPPASQTDDTLQLENKTLLSIIQQKDQELRVKDEDLALKDQELATKDREIAVKNAQLLAREQELRQKDGFVASLMGSLNAAQGIINGRMQLDGERLWEG
ncbi:hypothetical protein HYFRA_00013204 [Hymenoscyphus fraxineus]|uniref:Uncharacterized protein n=1 Tax=Hymenoscyphus fraxineus TaxID=746836 RepID=A0A9N9L7M1_9HELO|nr:hypothetical protein HYFRA_00013204 [Hymenoscyphus fraxineus]